jgi:hypothetical protein
MAKLTFKYVDGWPLMQPLGKKESELLKRNMAQGEQILGQVIGSDLSAKHADQMRKTFQPYMDAGRRVLTAETVKARNSSEKASSRIQ